MKISKRLLSISNLVLENEDIVDIGCDHCLVDIYLALEKNCNCKCYDMTHEIISKALKNIKKYNLDSKINTYVGNGFNDLNLNYDNLLIMSGMGTYTILKILNTNKTKSIICQTNTDLYLLRKNVCEMGYYIKDEEIVYDNKRFYVTIRFEEGNSNYNFCEYFLGPVLINKKDDLFLEYVNSLYNKINVLYKNNKKYDNFDSDKLRNILDCLKRYV